MQMRLLHNPIQVNDESRAQKQVEADTGQARDIKSVDQVNLVVEFLCR